MPVTSSPSIDQRLIHAESEPIAINDTRRRNLLHMVHRLSLRAFGIEKGLAVRILISTFVRFPKSLTG